MSEHAIDQSAYLSANANVIWSIHDRSYQLATQPGCETLTYDSEGTLRYWGVDGRNGTPLEQRGIPRKENSRTLFTVMRKLTDLSVNASLHINSETIHSMANAGADMDARVLAGQQGMKSVSSPPAEWALYRGVDARGQSFGAESIVLKNPDDTPLIRYSAIKAEHNGANRVIEIVSRRNQLLACVAATVVGEQVTLKDAPSNNNGFNTLIAAASPDVIDVGGTLWNFYASVFQCNWKRVMAAGAQLQNQLVGLNMNHGPRSRVADQSLPVVDELTWNEANAAEQLAA